VTQTTCRRMWARAGILAAIIVALLSKPLLLRAQEAIAPYCSELKRVADLASTNERFASISLKPREGNFTDSRLVLSGWSDCSVYATRIYTCDTHAIRTAQEAEKAQRKIFQEVQACLGTSWAEAKDRSSLGFIVLHHADQPISITLSMDETDQKQYLIRLILFGRTN
jgi:hypothetical protein